MEIAGSSDQQSHAMTRQMSKFQSPMEIAGSSDRCDHQS